MARRTTRRPKIDPTKTVEPPIPTSLPLDGVAKHATDEDREREYASMSSVLTAVLDAYYPDEIRVLEFGAGNYSTPLIADHAKSALVIETSEEWASKISEKLEDSKHVEIRHIGEPARKLSFDFSAYDVVVIDGDKNDRLPIANAAFKANVPVVVLHDTDKVGWYHYQNLNPGFSYEKLDFEFNSGSRRKTSVYVLTKFAARFRSIEPVNHRRLNG